MFGLGRCFPNGAGQDRVGPEKFGIIFEVSQERQELVGGLVASGCCLWWRGRVLVV